MRKHITKFFLALFIIGGGFQSCNKDDSLQSKIQKEDFVLTERDKDFSSLAKSIALSIKQNKDFGVLLKEEALLKYDGDYDIRFFHLLNNEVSSSDNKKSFTSIKVNDLLRNNMEATFNKKSSSDWSAYINMLKEKYPNLQISIPVHAEDWETENYIPDVTFVPENYDEQKTEEILAFNYKGELKTLDAQTDPEKAVIVVGLCERTTEVNSTKKILQLPGDDDEVFPPSTPYSLVANTNSTGIELFWSQDEGVLTPVSGYKIYRKSVHESSFSLIYTTNSSFAKLYNDNNVTKNETYYYYVKAYNVEGDSSPSTVVSAIAPDNPEKLASYDVELINLNSIQHRWSYPQGVYYDEIILKKGINTTVYQNFKTFNTNTYNYTETNFSSGNTYYYEIYGTDVGKQSEPLYDFIEVPYRDPSKTALIHIPEIYIDDVGDVEGWLYGAPEFRISAAGIKSGGNEFKYSEDVLYECDNRDHTHTFNNKGPIANWSYDDWFDVLTINVMEEDGAGQELKITIKAKFGVKSKPNSRIVYDFGAGLDYTITGFGNENCGNIWVEYQDQDKEYWTQSHGVKLDIETKY